MVELTDLAPVNDRKRLLDVVKNARVTTEFTKTDFTYIAIGTKERPAEIQAQNGEILRGDAIVFYGKYPKTPRPKWADLK